MFVAKRIAYRPANSDDPPTPIEEIGFSLVRLMRLSDGEATGVRANLRITDQDALCDLARLYTENQRVEWTFEMGGGGGSFRVVLRWTKFDRLAGTIQVVRTAVLRDLIREAEANGTDQREAARPADEHSVAPPQSRQNGGECHEAPPISTAPSEDGPAGAPSHDQEVSSLWPRLFGQDGDLKTDS
jgi:hypothetical protein